MSEPNSTSSYEYPNQETLQSFYDQGWETIWLKELDGELRPIDTGYRWRMEATFKLLHIPRGHPQTILDVGCGIGIYAINLAKRCPLLHVVGFDLSSRQIEIAHRLAAQQGVAERCRFFVGDANTTTLPETFDFITCTELLEHLPDPTLALRNLHAMGAKETAYVFSVPQYYHGRRQSGIFYKQVLPGGQEIHTQNRANLVEGVSAYEYYHALYSVKEASHLLETCGFSLEQTWGVEFTVPPKPVSLNLSAPAQTAIRAHNVLAKIINAATVRSGLVFDRFINRLFALRQAEDLIIRCRLG